MPRRPKTVLTIISIDGISELAETLEFLKKFSDTPSAVEMVDDKLLSLVKEESS